MAINKIKRHLANPLLVFQQATGEGTVASFGSIMIKEIYTVDHKCSVHMKVSRKPFSFFLLFVYYSLVGFFFI